mmetsp:Transcript_40880/g.102669  ORF Transcript_40880/g.102669 Transcript_40880/m.102669 type:complete len:219 (+) Transcript_40880:873-1529(+)
MLARKSGAASKLRITMSKRLNDSSRNLSRTFARGILWKNGSATRCQIASLSSSLLAIAAKAETFSSAQPICRTHSTASLECAPSPSHSCSSSPTGPCAQMSSKFFFKSVRRLTSYRHQIRRNGFTCSSRIITAPWACIKAALKGPSSGEEPTSSPLRCWFRAKKHNQNTKSWGLALLSCLCERADHFCRDAIVASKGWPQKCDTKVSTKTPLGFTSSE